MQRVTRFGKGLLLNEAFEISLQKQNFYFNSILYVCADNNIFNI